MNGIGFILDLVPYSFGSDHVERGELVRIAATRAKTFFPGEFSKRVHVGDTVEFIVIVFLTDHRLGLIGFESVLYLIKWL